MSLITPSEVNAIAFITPLDPSVILEEFIATAEAKYIVPAITQPIYDDLFLNPALYATLIEIYIKPYLAFCVKLMLYNQLLTESGTFSVPTQQRWDVVQELTVITKTKRNLLISNMTQATYSLYIPPTKKRISGILSTTTERPH